MFHLQKITIHIFCVIVLLNHLVILSSLLQLLHVTVFEVCKSKIVQFLTYTCPTLWGRWLIHYDLFISNVIQTTRPGLWSRSRRLGLKSYQRLGLVSRKIVNVSVSGGRLLGLISVSAIYVLCPRPIFDQIVQATVRSVNGL